MKRQFAGALLGLLLTGCGADANPTESGTTAVAALPTSVVTTTAAPTITTAPRPPTPTFVPTARPAGEAGQPASPPTTVPIEPTVASPPTMVNVEPTIAIPPTAVDVEPTTTPPPTVVSGEIGGAIRIEDTAWTGGWRNRGQSVYGGRTATWIYGNGTPQSTMQATFALDGPPAGPAQLIVEGMDSEDEAKTVITIAVNGAEIYAGPNPLPNDDLPLESGTWSAHAFDIDPTLLGAGANTITIRNQSPGPFGRPPFFMLDYADVVIGSR